MEMTKTPEEVIRAEWRKLGRGSGIGKWEIRNSWDEGHALPRTLIYCHHNKPPRPPCQSFMIFFKQSENSSNPSCMMGNVSDYFWSPFQGYTKDTHDFNDASCPVSVVKGSLIICDLKIMLNIFDQDIFHFQATPRCQVVMSRSVFFRPLNWYYFVGDFPAQAK